MRVRLEWTAGDNDSAAFLGWLADLGVKVVDRSVKQLAANKAKQNLTMDITDFEVKKPEPEVQVREKVVEKVKVIRQEGANRDNLPRNLYVIFHHNRPVLVVRDEKAAEETIGALRAEQVMVYQRVGYQAFPFDLAPSEAVAYLEYERLGDKWDGDKPNVS